MITSIAELKGLFLFILLASSLITSSRGDDVLDQINKNGGKYPYCIVGAGPAGLQMARHFEEASASYILIEKSKSPGSFFESYPRHGQLISINKRATGSSNQEFNLRHDWNSLLTSMFKANGTAFPFNKYSEEYYPPKERLHTYLTDYSRSYNLNLVLNTAVKQVSRDDGLGEFLLMLDPSPGYSLKCNVLIWAAGLGLPRMFKNPLYTPFHEAPLNSDFYFNKSLAIVGAGQSAFELAKAVYGHTASTYMLYRNAPSLSWSTHYPGHIRGVNNEIIDAYQLKSLDSLIQLTEAEFKWTETLAKRSSDGKLTFPQIESRLRETFDIVISAVGWIFDSSPFTGNVSPKFLRIGHDSSDRYPDIDGGFQSVNIPNLYFAGTVAHGLDKGKSSGGFIHGFRYNVRALARILLSSCNKASNPCTPWPVEDVGCVHTGMRTDIIAVKMAKNIMDRIGSTSGLYQMFGELQDVYILSGGCLRRYEEVPKRFVSQLLKNILAQQDYQRATIFTVTLKYKEGFSDPARYVLDPNRVVIPRLPGSMANGGFSYKELPDGWNELNFLHPVLETIQYDDPGCKELLFRPFHLMEDIRTRWDRPLDLVPLTEWIMVRTLSNPCEFSPDSNEAKSLLLLWQAFVVAAQGEPIDQQRSPVQQGARSVAHQLEYEGDSVSMMS